MPEHDTPGLDRVGLMIKPCSDSCVGACHYCYYYDPRKGKYAHDLLAPELLESFIRQFMALGCPAPMMSWQGGEPSLAGLDYFKQAVAWQKEYASPSQQPQNAFQTCGLPLDEDWCRFLAEETFLVGLSIDGPRDLHDSIRVDREGNPTHDRVVEIYRTLRQAGAEVNILVVVSSASLGRAGEIYRHIRELGCDFMQLIPCGPGREGRGHSKLMVDGDAYGRFFLDFVDAWIEEDNPGVFERNNDNLLHLYFGLPCEFCQFRRGCYSMVTAESDGSLYPCDFFVEEAYKLGNIRETPLAEMIYNEVHRRFFHETGLHHRMCRDCPWRRYCHGGCLRQRVGKGEEGGRNPRGRNMMCESMKLMFGGSFERFDAILAGKRHAPNLAAFFADLVRRYGWPRESRLPPPPGVRRVAGGGDLAPASVKETKRKRRGKGGKARR